MRYVIIGALAVMLTACASFRPYAPAVGGTLAGAACIPAGPEAAVFCAGTGAAVTAAVVGGPEPLSENPEIAKAQLKQRTIMDFLHWIIGGGVFLIIAAWLIPGPQITMPWRRKKDEIRIQQ